MQYRLVYGQLGTVKHISRDSTNSANKIYVKFDNDNSGLERMYTDKAQGPSLENSSEFRIIETKEI